MAAIMSRCGFRCDLCPAYVDNIGRIADQQAVSDGWFRYFGFRIPPEEIECTGCRGEGKQLDANCPIRPCVIARGLENCASCDDFDCTKMKERVDAGAGIRAKFPDLPEKEYQLFVRPYEGRKRLVRLRPA